MSSQSLLDQERFWEIVRYLVQLDRAKDFDDICKDLSLTKGQLNSFILFLKEVDCHLEYSAGANACKVIEPPRKQPKVTLEFNLLEWLQFQACFPKISENEGKPFYEDVRAKLVEAEKRHKNLDLFEPAAKLENLLDMSSPQVAGSDQALINDMVGFLEEVILEEKCLRLAFGEGKNMSVFPRKVVFLDGGLSLVAEGTRDKCLVNIGVSEIISATEEERPWSKLFSRLEINDFIASLRAVSENEVRLVLKVFSREKFNSDLKRHFFGNQFMFTNPQGEFIWAASIEPSEQIFSWLEDLGQDVEILDPLDFKKEFLKYCEARLKKLA